MLAAAGIDIDGRIGGSLQFFLYDVIKITILLCLLIFIISYIQSYFPPERSRKIIGRFHGVAANMIAALLGMKFKKAFPAVIIGICMATVIMWFISYVLLGGVHLLG